MITIAEAISLLGFQYLYWDLIFMGFIKNVLFGNVIIGLLFLPYLLGSVLLYKLGNISKLFDAVLSKILLLTLIFLYIITGILIYNFYLSRSGEYNLFVVPFIGTTSSFLTFLVSGYNPFVVPVSFMISPFTFFCMLAGARRVFNVNNVCPAGWEIYAFLIGIIYSLPSVIITGIMSFIFILEKRL